MKKFLLIFQKSSYIYQADSWQCKEKLHAFISTSVYSFVSKNKKFSMFPLWLDEQCAEIFGFLNHEL